MKPTGLGKPVIGLGMACLDLLVRWADVRKPLAAGRVLEFDVQGGGPAATAMVTVSRLGGRAEFWGAVGNDWIGTLILRGLRQEGVDVGQVRRVAGRRGPLMLVCIDGRTGQRYFFHMTGYCDSPRPVGALQRLRHAGCLLVDAMRPESDLPAARAARRLGVPVVADLGWYRPQMRPLLRYVDFALVSEDCARQASARGLRRAAERLRSLGPPVVIITLGSRGVAWLDGDRLRRMPAFGVRTVDTTGAGDVFHGAFCFGLVRGLGLEASLAFASAAAAMKCQSLGGRAGIPSAREVLRFLAARGCGLSAADRRKVLG